MSLWDCTEPPDLEWYRISPVKNVSLPLGLWTRSDSHHAESTITWLWVCLRAAAKA